ncbi:MAG: DNA primase [Pseudomonadota bacterium]
MAGRIPQSFIDELLARVDIVEVIDRYVPLKKAGNNYKACCPFHNEKTPSFNVSQPKQFYHCFGCGVSGTAISFLMDFDHMHFVDAVEFLADSVGLEVPRDAVAKVTQSQQGLFDALTQSASFFHSQLKTHQPAVDYLKNRGITGETALEFLLGFAPDQWHALTSATSCPETALVTTGMQIRNDSGKTHDRFRNRIMFPIRDRRGRVIGFGGRVMDNSEPKYLNSPETPLFQKGRELYGLYEFRKHKRNRADRIIVVEGYMDVIALAQHNIHNAVATLGTATSGEQVAMLFRETDEIVFCFDGDAAGSKAAWRALNSALPSLKSGRDARFLFLPAGEDPDSLVNRHGKEHFDTLVQQDALEASAFMFDTLLAQAKKGSDLSGTGHKARLAELVTPLIDKMPAGVYRELVSQQLNEMVGIEVLKATPAADSQQRPVNKPVRQTPVRRALTAILSQPAVVLDIDPEEYNFSDQLPGASLLLQVVAVIENHPDISHSGLLEHFRDKPGGDGLIKLAAATLGEDSQSELDDPLSIVRHAITWLNKETASRSTEQLNKPPSAMSAEEKQAFLQRINSLKK